MSMISGKSVHADLHSPFVAFIVSCITLFLCMLMVSLPSLASPFETFGLGARNIAMGGAVSAIAEDYTATYYNPAGLAFTEKIMVGGGFVYGSPNLRINGEKQDIELIRTLQSGIVFPLTRGRLKFVKFGVATNVPTSILFQTSSQDAKKPHFVFYNNHMNRLELMACVGIKILPWLSIGGGAALMTQMTFTEELQYFNPQETFLETKTPLKAKFSPLAGIRLKPTNALSFAVVYRGETSTTAVIDVVMSTFDVQFVPTLRMFISDLFKPHEIVLGASYLFGGKLLVGVDVAWMDYSKTKTSQPIYEIDAPYFVRVALSIINVPPPDFHDIFVPRAGVEYIINDHVSVRSGYCYKPSPVPDQSGITNYADTDKHIISTGVGVRFMDPFKLVKTPFNIEAVFQAQIFEHRIMKKDDPNDPVGDFTVDGEIFLGGIYMKHTF
jgi:long-chain fatty acid transport protein